MDPRTGAILALANWLAPGSQSSGEPADQSIGLNYEPGSTFKAITVAGALQDGLVGPNTQFDIPPILHFADRQISDAESHGYETLTVANILKVSSNIGADLIGMRLGSKRFDYWVRRFGFGTKTGVDLPGEQSGIVLHWWQYSGSSMANLPFGQGESVTPMQMVAAYSAIADGGILRAPHVVQSVGGEADAGRSRDAGSSRRRRPRSCATCCAACSPTAAPPRGRQTAATTWPARPARRTSRSTATTPTAPTSRRSSGWSRPTHPRLVVAVVVNQPQGSIFGGSVAAPAFQQIVGWAVPYLGIPPR